MLQDFSQRNFERQVTKLKFIATIIFFFFFFSFLCSLTTCYRTGLSYGRGCNNGDEQGGKRLRLEQSEDSLQEQQRLKRQVINAVLLSILYIRKKKQSFYTLSHI